MKATDKNNLILFVLSLTDGRPLDRAHLQKAVYLIQRELESVAGHQGRYNFVNHHYGVFCADVYSDVEALADSDLANIDAKGKSKDSERITVTDDGMELGTEFGRSLPYEALSRCKRDIDWVIGLTSFDALVERFYELFPETKTNSKYQGGRRGADMNAVDMISTLQTAGFNFQDRLRVFEFLSAHSFVMPTLIESGRRLPEYFPQSHFNLEVFTDPDDAGDDETLFVNVLTPLSTGEAVNGFDRFSRDWWLARVPETHGKLALGLNHI